MILAFLILLSTASTAQAVEIVKSVPFVGQSPMVYDPYKGAIWVIPKYLIEYRLGVPIYAPTNSVLAISDSDNAVLANVTVGQHPISLAYDSALHEVYVTTGNNVSVISDVSNSVVATIDSNTNFSRGGFYGIVYDSGKGEMFVSSVNGGVSVILVISCSIKQVVASIPITNNPSSLGLTYDSAKGEIYVSYNSFSELNSPCFISVISDSTNSVIATIPLDKGITFLELKPGAYDSATGEIYLPTSNNS
ncbi:MAG TPA: hypothetical protein VK253_05295, partial [Candidatus Binatia bacterium]|nr:hypothetical protein [Candidatus Binatia bacterium]